VKSPPKSRNGKNGRIAYRFFTRQHSGLTHLYSIFYRNKKKIVPAVVQLDPIILAVWFMDDGSKSYKTFYLNSQQFDSSSQQKLMRLLKYQYGISSALNRDKQYYRIRIKQDSAEKFRKIIGDYIIPSMRYKLGEWPRRDLLYYIADKRDSLQRTPLIICRLRHNFTNVGGW